MRTNLHNGNKSWGKLLGWIQLPRTYPIVILDAPNMIVIPRCTKYKLVHKIWQCLMKKQYFISIKLILFFYHHIFSQPEILILTYSHTWSLGKVLLATSTKLIFLILVFTYMKKQSEIIELFDFPNPIFKSFIFIFIFL